MSLTAPTSDKRYDNPICISPDLYFNYYAKKLVISFLLNFFPKKLQFLSF